MTMHTQWTDQLSAYLDDELDPAARGRLEAHLAQCDQCDAIRVELERVVREAKAYRGIEPGSDLWPAIERGIDRSRVVELRPARRAGPLKWVGLAAAAAGLLAVGVGGGIWFRGRQVEEVAVTPTVAAPPAAVPASNSAVISPAYDAAVVDLERSLAANRTRLDSTTVRVVEESLRTIDRAIAEARAAIQRDSTNAYLSEQIAANMRRKLALLRVAARAASKET
jgi:anti-sigma factor RsiW